MHGGISRKGRRHVALTSLLAAGALAGTAIVGNASASTRHGGATPITIGISLSLSGDFSADGHHRSMAHHAL